MSKRVLRPGIENYPDYLQGMPERLLLRCVEAGECLLSSGSVIEQKFGVIANNIT